MVYLALVALAFVFLIIRKARPASNKSGIGFNNPIKDEPRAKVLDESKISRVEQGPVLKVATFNIQTGKNLQGRRNIKCSAEVISAADLVGVQEVYAPSWLNHLGFGASQSEHLSIGGGFSWLFSATRRRWLREHRGNALFSKIEMSDWQIKMLPDRSGKSYRNLTIAQANWNGKRFHILNTHLHTKAGRREQIDVVLREFANYSPAILLGDFNCTAEELVKALTDVEITDAIKVAKLDPHEDQRIDWILTKGFVVDGGEFLGKGVSDHPYYQVNLR